ncbi:MAG: hypothetical protein EP329_04040 [Deltaproteobacteria bacterium]|nr:MAG: hypothetical protein EP329_04040 [Deltaproteobacteria bacterium]
MRIALALLALVFIAFPGCDSGTGDNTPATGTVTLKKDDGVDFHTGALQDPGNYKNSDLFTASNGSALQLLTGGDSPTDNRPVNWFLGNGGVHRTFASLAEIPDEPPTEDMTASLIKAKTGNGFILMTHKGALVRGRVTLADADTVTLEFEPYVPAN